MKRTKDGALKRFLIDTSVENAEGTQTWFVDAETEQEALDKFSSGAGDLYESNVEVTRCGEPEISGEVPLDDFGRFAEQPPVAQPAPVCHACESIEWEGKPCQICQPVQLPAAQPAPSQYGSPELQAMIVARAIEKDRAAQRPWVGLTDEEVKHEWTVWRASLPRYIGFAFGIEAKLKEKNT